jgi:acyl dehydratase
MELMNVDLLKPVYVGATIGVRFTVKKKLTKKRKMKKI